MYIKSTEESDFMLNTKKFFKWVYTSRLWLILIFSLIILTIFYLFNIAGLYIALIFCGVMIHVHINVDDDFCDQGFV